MPTQTHNQFQTFIIDKSWDLVDGKVTSPSGEAIYEFLQNGGVAPKSVGIEHLESKDLTIMTIGYRDDEEPVKASISQVRLGQLDLVPEVISTAFAKAASNEKNVICHEFYVTADGTFYAVFLTADD